MLYLTLIADDFTGAIDTSVQFAGCGLQTYIYIYKDKEPLPFDKEMEILVIDAETRHLDARETYARTRRIASQLKELDLQCLYIKTDSALRGEIGNMIKAVMDEYKKHFLPFVPAFPESGRTTEKGIQYIHGIPVNESVFGTDPFDPVLSSRVSDHFTKHGINTVEVGIGVRCSLPSAEPMVAIFDAVENEDLEAIAADLRDSGQISLVAGCAGFARVLPATLKLPGRKQEVKIPDSPFFVICGSLNPVTRHQIEYAESHGFERFTLTPEHIYQSRFPQDLEGNDWYGKLVEALKEGKNIILDTGISEQNRYMDYLQEKGIHLTDARVKIADLLGMLIAKLIETGNLSRQLLMIVGGDTFLGFYNKTGCTKITPLLELDTGTVLSACRIDGTDYPVISKSGGLGKESLLYDLMKMRGVRRGNE